MKKQPKNKPNSTQKQTKYNAPYFWWRVEWVEYMDSIQSNPERLNFARSVAEYGLFGNEPYCLTCEDLDYFNDVVRPDLDGQRKRLKEGKKLWNKRK